MNGEKSQLGGKAAGSFGSLSAFLATLGSSWNVCHSVCMALLAFLAGFGIIIAGFPLFFLFQYNVQLWLLALALSIVSLAMLLRMPKCVSKKLLFFNAGVLIAGVPANLVNLQPFSWIIGGIIALAAIAWFLNSKIKKVGR
ncbi:MAG TPA: hypothetical protein HA222_05230 [Candidatus Diapherotrites archaeon]|uniref:MerC domain-containing protein n=1 Tax=Candidatus Iainarchaeum sp. TaxID=3101447 RepID=A0A7J4KUK7_9ARCH|nr:hypothetical protein [Candidatus Diapherotrites archaeon]HIH33612.1 hypothetical protein [Candidatus Diapherotrites archaeon]